jgi:Na+-driven multidrug efflux pump
MTSKKQSQITNEILQDNLIKLKFKHFFITIISYIFGQELITFMAGSGEVDLEGTKYLKIIFISQL